MRKAVKERTYDAVLLDLILDDEDGLSAIPFLVQECPNTKIIMMSAHGTIEIAVSAMEKGATAFISKSKDPQHIIAELKRRLATKPDYADQIQSYGIIGTSQAIKDVVARINQIKNVDTNLLITGEHGTGKEFIARAIHNASPRSSARFEGLNCGAIAGNLLESELFGHKKGTAADSRFDRKGMFEICRDGFLLLDEISDMPLELQSKVFQVIQEKRYTPAGANAPVTINTRIIAATSQNLVEKIRLSSFREDLYHQLAAVKIEMPPLRDRAEDIPMLINCFLSQFNQKFGKSVLQPGRVLEKRLTSYRWPGNIQELRNAVERGVVLSNDGTLQLENMLNPVTTENTNITAITDSDAGNPTDAASFEKTLSAAKQEFERKYLQHLLETTRGNISEMARISGRYRTDIYRLLTKHGVDWEDFRPD